MFVLGKFSQASLILSSKAGAYPCQPQSLVCAHKYPTSLKTLHEASALAYFADAVSDEEKSSVNVVFRSSASPSCCWKGRHAGTLPF